ncbi:MAG: transposase [Patescibacteria group bacterium]
MPSKNVVKTYIEKTYYHIYNRGVEKRKIFLDDQDYKTFLSYLKTALLPPQSLSRKSFTLQGVTFKGIPRQPKNFFGIIDLVAYVLMPNHFHLMIQQNHARSINEFMQSLCTRYAMYFNKKYKRIGTLFQNTYKAVMVQEEPYLLHLTRYIHRNPLNHTRNLTVAYSSYAEYLGKRQTPWIKPQLILSFFDSLKHPFLNSTNTYKSFVEDYEDENNLDEELENFTLE